MALELLKEGDIEEQIHTPTEKALSPRVLRQIRNVRPNPTGCKDIFVSWLIDLVVTAWFR
ncbi:hypothetical protein DRO64_01495 [Candidatus Bathyarchaeota archaeon]|nr:MAG: hypothetical protein DRO64_01495 [Candidatus Bathyarchaeota archaeon]